EAKPVARKIAAPQAAILQRVRADDRRDVVAQGESVLANGAVDVAGGVGDVDGTVRPGRELKRRKAAAVGGQAWCVLEPEAGSDIRGVKCAFPPRVVVVVSR